MSSQNKEIEYSIVGWTSGNKKIDDFIQERQLKINNHNEIVFEWIPYNQFNEIKETGNNGSITIYSTIWSNGPLLHKKAKWSSYYTRDSNKEVALKCFHNFQNPVDSLINEAKKYSTINDKFFVLYGISQNPDTNDYILVLTWTSGNEKIDQFIQERQLTVNNHNDVVFEWIPYNQFNEIKEKGKNGSITVYSAIWRNGPLHYSKYTRDSNKEVALKCLHNLQNPVDSLINEAKKYSTINDKFLVLYGISQNPDTSDYILVLTWTSGNGKIDSFIQERQLNINFYDDVIFEWIPYNQFNEIKETGKNGSITVYSAIWRNGPLHYDYFYKKYTRDSNKEVALKCLHNLQNPFDSLINEANKYSKIIDKFLVLYGISQNPDTNDYILVLTWTSGNGKIDDFIQERQLKINNNNNVVFEWIPYNQFNEIRETGKNGSITVYSAIWRNGPLYKKSQQSSYYTRDSNKEVALKCLHNLQKPVDSLINETKKYSTIIDKFFVLYGISQNPDTSDYILVLTWTSGNEKIYNFVQERQLKIKINNHNNVFEWIPYSQFNKIRETGKNGSITVYSAIWRNGPLHYDYDYDEYTRDSNKVVALKCLHNLQNPVDSLINEAKKYPTLNDKFFVLYGISQNPDTIFEWIPYNQFIKIKETGNNGSMTVFSALWRNGPLYYDYNSYSKYTRDSNKEVVLKCFHNLQNPVDFLINETKKYSTKSDKFLVLYGISQNPYTDDYILVFSNKNFGKECGICNEIYTDIQYKWCKPCNFMGWKSGNDKIDGLIQLKINERSDTRFKWIPYNQFNRIKNIGKGHFVTVYSATWEYEVALVCFNDSQKFLYKVKESDNKFEMYGISQNPDIKDYILVLQNEYCMEYGKTYCKNCGEKYGHIDHTWCKGGFSTVYSAIWKDGPLKYNVDKEICTRVSNKKVALKCLNNSQNAIDRFLNEVRAYSINKKDDILNVYGISQNPNTKNYIIVIEYADGGSYNNWISINYRDFDWRNKIQTLLSIIEGLKGIHKKQKVHHDFHTGNILFLTKNLNILNRKSLFISDMGLCEDLNNTSEVKTYGVIPYMAPEVLRRKPYTQAADIYSFGNRPSAAEIHVEIKSFYDCYSSYKKGDSNAIEIKKQFKEAEIYRKSHLSSFKRNKQHSGAIYTSRSLDPFTKDLLEYDNSECVSCIITD
ncbi:uncharacterized protein OCT59_008672 [Rhizophagus irregularis]|uniref:uncharacterized protein n=1 Tax=Rhizophagus irregularis TaxID=588596 RepID=UPI00332455DF|nr:hypothetical protein OCT59_008672 [Rhizophagus irregularis]